MKSKLLRFISTLALASTAAGTGCSTNEPESPGSGAGGAGNDQADAGASAVTVRTPISVWEPDLPTEGQFCSMLVAVECDGNEDCPDGQTCCGTLNGGSFTYDSVRCEDKCELADGGRTICHEGDPCPTEGEECMRSLILPSYLGICGTPSAFTPQGFDGASTEPEVVNCGVGAACATGEICCALTSWNADIQGPEFTDGRCVGAPAECGCSAGEAPQNVSDTKPTSDVDGGPADAGAAD